MRLDDGEKNGKGKPLASISLDLDYLRSLGRNTDASRTKFNGLR